MTPEQISEVNSRAVENLQAAIDSCFGRGGWPSGAARDANPDAPRIREWKYFGGKDGAWADLGTGAHGNDLISLACHMLGVTDRETAAAWLKAQLDRHALAPAVPELVSVFDRPPNRPHPRYEHQRPGRVGGGRPAA